MPGEEQGGSLRNINPNLAEIQEILYEGLALRGIDRAARIAGELTEEIRQRFAGGSLYIPLSLPPRLARDAQIFDEFTGGNHLALAVRYGTTCKTIYAVIRRERQRRAGPNSPPPPDGRRKKRPPENW